MIGATHADIRTLVGMGSYIEHSFCMFIEVKRGKTPMFPPEELDALIKAGTVERTILASDLGQSGNDRPVDGFRSLMGTCIDLGYTDAQIRPHDGGQCRRADRAGAGRLPRPGPGRRVIAASRAGRGIFYSAPDKFHLRITP